MNKTELIKNIKAKQSFLCVGLDSDIRKIPEHLRDMDNPVLEFNKAIIDATAPYCVAYKPNLAFYEADGADGWQTLMDTVQYIRKNHPNQFIIADAKRGDIGNTSRLYARAIFEELDADAITVAPYMGEDSVSPFLGYKDKWVVLLALTSNPGSADFQTLELANGRKLFEQVLDTSKKWGSDEELMYVVGATRGSLLGEVRQIVPNSFLLVPGIGAQGGSLEEVCKYGMTKGCGLLVNSSRGIIFASQGTDFAEVAAFEAKKLADEMAIYLHKFDNEI